MIDLIDVYKIYKIGDSEIRALDGINLHIKKNEFVAIVGQSGSGKSTCMNMIGCLDIPTSGQYIINGKDASKLKEDELSELRNLTLGFIFQQYNLISKLNVFENVELPLIYRGVEKDKRKKMVEESLERVGLSDRILNMPSQLSGGQQQRVSIARALSGKPPVILADEPTGALDSKTGAEVLELLKEINREGNTIILITHDNSIAAQAKRVVRLHDGTIIEDKILEVVENEF
jgi:putative ABC transport system ATP-binding protein